ncbi:sigma 54-interacting transcriptional regulator [Sorangium sp. So ce131]|uniref:sigma 54-interacting transcriptional regulator n=1 Tax=Sorangium sp. So ce131 TaxID=3133282 RepID=UPI003F617FA0
MLPAMPDAWIEFIGPPRKDVTGVLMQAGVHIVHRGAQDELPPGLLFFEELKPYTFEALRKLTACSMSRVLAVAASRAALEGDAHWRLLAAGASDVIAWINSRVLAEQIASRLERWQAVDRIISSPPVQSRLVGSSKAWRRALRQVVEVAAFTSAPVLILGESGTGKEEVARLIHELDCRPDKREWITLDCTTVVPELSGSEFFGHERGAFTGAAAARDGAFALADGGTLFLDEVGELPLGLQAQLLRVVQERSYKRVGSNVWHHADFRLVCATNRDLAGEVDRGGFRRDFFHRIAGWTIRLPPLRERPEDILPLVHHLIRTFLPEASPPELDDPVREYFLRRSYAGNVRELRQLVSRVCRQHVGPGPITVGDLPLDELPAVAPTAWQDAAFTQAIRRALSLGVGLREISRITSETAIHLALEEHGNLQRAAKHLGVTDRALQLRKTRTRASRGCP